MARQLGSISIGKISLIYGEVALEKQRFIPVIGTQSCRGWHGGHGFLPNCYGGASRQPDSLLLASYVIPNTRLTLHRRYISSACFGTVVPKGP